MTAAKLILIPVFCTLAACGGSSETPPTRAFDLHLSQPSPHANYIRVGPGRGTAGMPRPQQIVSPEFSAYLQDHTGCVRDASRPTAVLGNQTVPAGYMVPVTCS